MDCRKCEDVSVEDTHVKSRDQTVTIAGFGGGHVLELGAGFLYDGFAVISIDFQNSPTGDRPNRILFDESTTSARDDHNENFVDEATFIHDIKYIGGEDKNGKRKFQADKLTVKEAQVKFVERYGENTKAFFYIHGNITEAGYVFQSTKKVQGEFAKNKIVPVIWPSELGNTAYFTNKNTYLPIAKDELNKLLSTVDEENAFKGKNLICHSLGNYLLRKLASEENDKVKFDNIFMIAADVRHNLFDTDYINRKDGSKDGLNIFRMLDKYESTGKPKGKIHVFHNWDDGPLQYSTNVGGNWLNRLGQAGMGTYDKWFGGWGENKNLVHPEIRNYYQNIDAGKILRNPGADNDRDKHDKDEHGYMWYMFAIKHYKLWID